MFTQTNIYGKRKLSEGAVWGILAIYVCIVGNPFWLSQRISEVQREREKHIVRPGDYRYREINQDIEAIITRSEMDAAEGILSPTKVAEYQDRVLCLCGMLEKNHGDISASLVQKGREEYLKRWHPPQQWAEWAHSHFQKMGPDQRKLWIEQDYYHELLMAQEHVRSNTRSTYRGPSGRTIILWILKWYYLFTIPGLLIVLVNLRLAGVSVLARFIIEPRRVLMACAGGPLGLIAISDSAFQYRRYCRLESELLAGKPYGTRLTEQEKSALWAQVNEPLLRFERALELVQSGSVAVSKPLLASLLIWLGSIHGASRVSVFSSPTAIHAVYMGGDDWLPYSGNTTFHPPPLACSYLWDMEIISTLTVIWDCVRVTPKPHLRSKRIARGPPSAVEERCISSDTNNLLNCSMQERRLS